MNLKDAVRREISFKDPKSGKTYQLKQKVGSPYFKPDSRAMRALQPKKHVMRRVEATVEQQITPCASTTYSSNRSERWLDSGAFIWL